MKDHLKYERSLYDRLWIYVGLPLIIFVGAYFLISVSWILVLIWFGIASIMARELFREAIYAEINDNSVEVKTLFKNYSIPVNCIIGIKTTGYKYEIQLDEVIGVPSNKITLHKNWPYDGQGEQPFIDELLLLKQPGNIA